MASVVNLDERKAQPSAKAVGLAKYGSAISIDSWILLAAAAAPIAVASALIPGRGHLDSGDNALILVVVIVAIASTGRRLAAFVAALVSALSFDFFLTRPYHSFRITRQADLITELLLLVVGLIVGDLAARGRNHRSAASESRYEVTQLHAVTELAASGQEPHVLVSAASAELEHLLFLRQCEFVRHALENVTARVVPSGEVTVGRESWPTHDLGLPTHGVDLPVRGGGWLLGHFLLTPTAGKPISHERLLVAVAIADQVGAAIAVDHPVPVLKA
jgi:K+-sensing histidine kinase KdpD